MVAILPKLVLADYVIACCANLYFLSSTTEEDWMNEGEEFRRLWDLPNCVGGIDGKHVRIRCPAKGGSIYYNYKKFHSILLLAVVDSKLRIRDIINANLIVQLAL